MAGDRSLAEWKTVRLGELGRVVTGKTPPTKVDSHFGGTVPFITPRDLDGRKTISSTERYLTEKGVAAVKNAVIPSGAVIVSCIGSDLGKAAIAGCRSVTNQQINSIIVDDEWNAEFIYYNLSTRQDELKHHAASGSAVPILNKGHFSDLTIDLPPLQTQREIVRILGSLDDKIELNRRMNGVLEGMARAIFKAWFVDFEPVRARAAGATRFPGMPQTLFDQLPNRFVDSELGEIPDGWEVVTVGNVTHRVTKGDTPRRTAVDAAPKNDPRVKLIRANAISEDGEILYDKLIDIPHSIHVGKSKRSVLAPNFVLYTNAGTIGRVAFVTEDIIPANTNQAVAILQPDESKLPPKFLYMSVRQPEFQEELHRDITQAVQANLALGKISAAKLVVPPAIKLRRMFAPLEQLIDLIFANRRESAALRKVRDALLPKLISGELAVPVTKGGGDD